MNNSQNSYFISCNLEFDFRNVAYLIGHIIININRIFQFLLLRTTQNRLTYVRSIRRGSCTSQ